MAAATTDRPPPHRARAERAPRGLSSRIYFDVKTLARVLGWSVRRTRRWLHREKAIVRHGRHYFTTRGLLRRAFPDTWQEVLAGAEHAHVEDDDD